MDLIITLHPTKAERGWSPEEGIRKVCMTTGFLAHTVWLHRLSWYHVEPRDGRTAYNQMLNCVRKAEIFQRRWFWIRKQPHGSPVSFKGVLIAKAERGIELM